MPTANAEHIWLPPAQRPVYVPSNVLRPSSGSGLVRESLQMTDSDLRVAGHQQRNQQRRITGAAARPPAPE